MYGMDDRFYQKLQNGGTVEELPIEIVSITDVSILNVDVADSKTAFRSRSQFKRRSLPRSLDKLFRRYRIGLSEAEKLQKVSQCPLGDLN